ncbi:MFS transporter [Pseudomonas fluorescens]|uniref:MFS transporter n=1 Tax=Pseudomonas fluorescens TaxID=294 RepID=UPI003C18C341
MNDTSSKVGSDPDLVSATKKVFKHVIPLFLIMYVLNYIDRVNIGFVKTHLETDLGIGAAAYGIGAGMFFIGYCVFEVPANMLLQRLGARIWLTRILFSWGLVATLMAFIQSETHFYILRFLLGVSEAGFFPGVILYLSQWLPANERGRAVVIFMSGSAIASIIAGPVSGALLRIEGWGLHGWQWMFMIEGSASVFLAFFMWNWLKSKPEDAEWMSDAERAALYRSLDHEQLERGAGKHGHTSAFKLLKDPKIAMFCLVYFVIQMTIYAVTFWLPSMIKAMGVSNDLQVGFFNSIPWIMAVIGMYLIAVGAKRWKHQHLWVALSLLIAAAGLFAATFSGPVYAFVALCFAAIGFKAAASSFWPIPQGYLDRRIAAAVIGLISAIGNLGGFVAPVTFGLIEQNTGSVSGGLMGLAIIALIGAGVTLALRVRSSNETPAIEVIPAHSALEKSR